MKKALQRTKEVLKLGEIMKIQIKEAGGHKLCFPIPTGAVFGHITAAILPHALKDEGITITKKQAYQFIRELRRYKKAHPDWVLVDIEDAGGDTVKITV